MINDNVKEWIGTLRSNDQSNVSLFLETSLDYLSRHVEYLKGSGLYVVGSSYTGKTFELKEHEKRRRLAQELVESLREKYTTEQIHNHISGLKTIPELGNMLVAGHKQMWEEIMNREYYEDVDMVIAGLPQDKTYPDNEMWKGFTRHLRRKLPASKGCKHPRPAYDFDTTNGFRYWIPVNLGHMLVDPSDALYQARAYELQMPCEDGATKIHFMLYISDSRFDPCYKTLDEFLEHRGESVDVSLDKWKAIQAKDNLPYLAVAEF